MAGGITDQADQYGQDVEAHQVIAYLAQCFGDMFFYRLLADFQAGGYFFVSQVLFAAQLIDFPALGREGVDKPVDLIGDLFQQKGVVLVIAEDFLVDQFVDRVCSLDSFLHQGGVQVVNGTVVGGTVEVGLDRVVEIYFLFLFPKCHKNILDDIFCRLPVVDEAVGVGGQRLKIGVKQLPEQRDVACSAAYCL